MGALSWSWREFRELESRWTCFTFVVCKDLGMCRPEIKFGICERSPSSWLGGVNISLAYQSSEDLYKPLQVTSSVGPQLHIPITIFWAILIWLSFLYIILFLPTFESWKFWMLKCYFWVVVLYHFFSLKDGSINPLLFWIDNMKFDPIWLTPTLYLKNWLVVQ